MTAPTGSDSGEALRDVVDLLICQAQNAPGNDVDGDTAWHVVETFITAREQAERERDEARGMLAVSHRMSDLAQAREARLVATIEALRPVVDEARCYAAQMSIEGQGTMEDVDDIVAAADRALADFDAAPPAPTVTSEET